MLLLHKIVTKPIRKEAFYMMMIPRKNDFDLWDDAFGDIFFHNHESKVMKTDIEELRDKYVIAIDLPGYEKENIKMSIEEGYLTINASTNTTKEEQEKGKFVRKERYTGTCSRSFYVGDGITKEDIKANFRNGILKIDIPKAEERVSQEKQYIEIED